MRQTIVEAAFTRRSEWSQMLEKSIGRQCWQSAQHPPMLDINALLETGFGSG